MPRTPLLDHCCRSSQTKLWGVTCCLRRACVTTVTTPARRKRHLSCTASAGPCKRLNNGKRRMGTRWCGVSQPWGPSIGEDRLTCLRTAGENEKLGTSGGGTSRSLLGIEPSTPATLASCSDPPAMRQVMLLVSFLGIYIPRTQTSCVAQAKK